MTVATSTAAISLAVATRLVSVRSMYDRASCQPFVFSSSNTVRANAHHCMIAAGWAMSAGMMVVTRARANWAGDSIAGAAASPMRRAVNFPPVTSKDPMESSDCAIEVAIGTGSAKPICCSFPCWMSLISIGLGGSYREVSWASWPSANAALTSASAASTE